MLRSNSTAAPIYGGPILVRVRKVLCDDGRRRVAVPTRTVTQNEARFPGRVTVFCRIERKNKAVTGEIERVDGDWFFTAYPDHKNGDIFDINEVS